MAKASKRAVVEHVAKPLSPEVVPRAPTEEEWIDLVADFPHLVQEDVVVTGEATFQYNCIAWSLGITNRWINPPQPLSAFEALYALYGYVPTHGSPAIIDGWRSYGEMTHGSRVSAMVGLWESKLGASLRITHARDGVRGDLYGEIVVSFTSATGKGVSSMLHGDVRLSEFEEARLQHEVGAVADGAAADFERDFRAWRATWHTGSNAFLNDTYELARGAEFGNLVAMGPAIVPLVVNKMMTLPDGFFALPLYEAIMAGREHLQVRHETADDMVEGEQARAVATARAWLRR